MKLRNMTALTSVLFLLFSLLTSGCGNTVKGSGVSKTETREVGSFESVRAGGVTRLEVTFGEKIKVEVESDDNILAHLHTAVENNMLVITSDNIFPKVGPTVRVTLPTLTGVELSGASSAVVPEFKGESLSVNVSGASRMKVDGAVERLEVKASGSAEIDGGTFKVEAADVEASGAGQVDLGEVKELSSAASGSARIRYKGTPHQPKNEVSGAAKVESF